MLPNNHLPSFFLCYTIVLFTLCYFQTLPVDKGFKHLVLLWFGLSCWNCVLPSFPKAWDLECWGKVGRCWREWGTEQWQWPISELLQLSLMTAASYAGARGSKEQKQYRSHIWCLTVQQAFQSISQGDSESALSMFFSQSVHWDVMNSACHRKHRLDTR